MNKKEQITVDLDKNANPVDVREMSDQELRMYCVEQVAKWGQVSTDPQIAKYPCSRLLADEASYVYSFIKAQYEYSGEVE